MHKWGVLMASVLVFGILIGVRGEVTGWVLRAVLAALAAGVLASGIMLFLRIRRVTPAG